MTTRGFGLAGELATKTILTAAAAAEQAGYDTFWLSQPREGSTLATLQEVARETQSIRLGIGAIPLTRMEPEEMIDEIVSRDLPQDRLRLGIGSGTGPDSLARLRHGVKRLRQLTGIEIVVAPLGPKMCTLAGELADMVLLNWLVPSYAATSTSWIRDGASVAGRDMPIVASYVRCALGESVRMQLDVECGRYGAFPHYAAHFGRQGVRPIETTIHATNVEGLHERLSAYDRVLDHVVVRAITANGTPAEVSDLVRAAQPRT